ncbi:trk system potassium uptake protein TrkH [Seinonella peptonophila]|uniref:Trk system potassium uptake protein TrkH n=1 Tax=Seinonella peptonophila TaxID=112248 RepID=A0A1M4SRZ8_9BACL|nr:TrkH family potassium uptake protein [Seinonella peptonophila]SHE34767.1 trk system potassium uptake protein TrkH [Seinonella peptonophila]
MNTLSPARYLVIGFFIVTLFGGILLSLPMTHQPGQNVSFIDALFTSTSAICVTGLVVVDTATSFNLVGQIIILMLVQIGGIGFVTFATLFTVMLGKKVSVRERLLLAESFKQNKIQGVVRLLIFVMSITFIFELMGTLLLSIRFIPQWGLEKGLYFSFFHAVSAFNNAGFDLFGHVEKFSSFSLYADDPLVSFTISGLVIVGGLGFIVIYELFHYWKTKRLSLHSKLVLATSGFLLILGTFVILLIEWSNPETLGNLSFQGKLWAAHFHAASPRSGGISTLSLTSMYSASLFFIVFLMFIGAAPGSTGGGIKSSTFAIIILAVWGMLRGKQHVEIFKRRISYIYVYRALTITILAIGFLIFGTMTLTILERTDIFTALFETVSAFGTVGFSLGLTPKLSIPGKILIIILMFIGRLGPITIGFALANRSRPTSYKYPEEKLVIG